MVSFLPEIFVINSIGACPTVPTLEDSTALCRSETPNRIGALYACVDGYESGPNALFDLVIGHAGMEYQSWQKKWET